MRFALALLVFVSLRVEAFACPFCQSDVGKQVRDGIFNDGFALNAILTLIPFAVLFAIVALVYFGPPRSSRLDGASDE
jgi:hypothetical protein